MTLATGTTTATILANSILSEGIRYSSLGLNPITMQRGIQTFVDKGVEYIKNNFVTDIKDQPEKVLQIATVSANWDEEIGKTVADAINTVGVDGAVHIEDAKSYKTSLKIVNGIQFDRGFLSPYFINETDKQIANLEDCYVLLYKGTFKNFKSLFGILKQIKKDNKNLLLVADDFEPDVLQSLVINKTKLGLGLCAIKAPWFAEMRINTMNDLAVYMNTQYYDPISEDFDLSLMSLDDLGKCDRVIVSSTQTTFINNVQDNVEIKKRIKQLKDIKETKNLNEIDRGNIDLRIKQLCGSVAFITIGAKSEAEFSEKKDRYDDALKACRAALAEGIVPGGGYSYIKFAFSELFEELKNEVGIEIATIMRNAFLTPFKTLMSNDSKEDDISDVLSKIRSSSEKYHGYNVKTHQFENLLESGVIDPFKVTRSALENAASVASLMLTCSGVITDIDSGPKKVIDVSNNIPSLF